MKRVLLAAIGLTVAVCAGPAAQQRAAPEEAPRVVQVQPNFYMIAGAGGNIAVQIGPDGIVLVDSGSGQSADAVVRTIKQLSDRPIRYIINTSADADHVGGNETLAKAGQSLFTAANGGPGGGTAATAISNGGAASIVGTEAVLTRMSAPTGARAPFPTVAWPTETFTRKQKTLYLNNEGIQIIHQPSAHTDGDSIVFFRRSDVVATGDIFDTTRFPIVDVERGGSIQGEIDALNRIIELTIPSIPLPWKEGGTQIVPGHGRISEQAEVVEYRDMVTIARDRIREMIRNGMTLPQIQAASPTKGYTRRYGADSGRSTTAMFVEAIYRSLMKK
jgi:glyoxylase-like metal-dependent hydrolase (beta-lactamase superfamily II)